MFMLQDNGRFASYSTTRDSTPSFCFTKQAYKPIRQILEDIKRKTEEGRRRSAEYRNRPIKEKVGITQTKNATYKPKLMNVDPTEIYAVTTQPVSTSADTSSSVSSSSVGASTGTAVSSDTKAPAASSVDKAKKTGETTVTLNPLLLGGLIGATLGGGYSYMTAQKKNRLKRLLVGLAVGGGLGTLGGYGISKLNNMS